MSMIDVHRVSKQHIGNIKIGVHPYATKDEKKLLSRANAALVKAMNATKEIDYKYNVSEAIRLLKRAI